MSNEGLGITLVDQSDNMTKDGETVAYPFKIIGTAHLCTSLIPILLCSLIHLLGVL